MYLRHCSLVACTLDLTFWVYTALELVYRLLAFESLKPSLAFVLEDLLVSPIPYIDLWDTELILSSLH